MGKNPHGPEFSVVIPVFNEEMSIPILHTSLHAVMETLSRPYEVIYVNDGSTDSSPAVLERLKRDYPEINVLSSSENRGQFKALSRGFKSAMGKWIITLDGDLQNPPEEIPKLIQYKDSFDVVIGIRKRRKDGYSRKIASIVARFFRWLILRDQTKDAGCALRVFKKEILENVPYCRNFQNFFVFFARLKGYSVKEIHTEHRHRRFGKSKHGIVKRAVEGVADLRNAYHLKQKMNMA